MPESDEALLRRDAKTSVPSPRAPSDDEVWVAAVGWEGVYEVSDTGRVRSVDRSFVDSMGRSRSFTGRELKLTLGPVGYLQVMLCRNGANRVVRVHRLVAEAFLPRGADATEVCHWDGNPINNCVENLRWDTPSANAYDTVRQGRNSGANQTNCLRGHPLSGRNLRANHLRLGRRACLACSRAIARVNRQPHLRPQLQGIADAYCAALLGEPALTDPVGDDPEEEK